LFGSSVPSHELSSSVDATNHVQIVMTFPAGDVRTAAICGVVFGTRE
jgi:hypothetical protein